MNARVRGCTAMHLHLSLPWAAAVRRAALALAACAVWLAGTPAAGQRDAAVPIRLPIVTDWSRLGGFYPAAAREAGTTHAYVWMKFRVLADGAVDTASISVISVQGQPGPAFVQPAKEFVAGTRFTPATVGGRPVAAWIRFLLDFQDPRVPSSSVMYDMGGFEQPPVLLNPGSLRRLVEAHYPPALREAGVAGSVLVRFDVAPTGAADPDRIEVQLMTDPALEEPARAIVRTLRFHPARRNGGPVKGWVTMPLHFGRVLRTR